MILTNNKNEKNNHTSQEEEDENGAKLSVDECHKDDDDAVNEVLQSMYKTHVTAASNNENGTTSSSTGTIHGTIASPTTFPLQQQLQSSIPSTTEKPTASTTEKPTATTTTTSSTTITAERITAIAPPLPSSSSFSLPPHASSPLLTTSTTSNSILHYIHSTTKYMNSISLEISNQLEQCENIMEEMDINLRFMEMSYCNE